MPQHHINAISRLLPGVRVPRYDGVNSPFAPKAAVRTGFYIVGLWSGSLDHLLICGVAGNRTRVQEYFNQSVYERPNFIGGDGCWHRTIFSPPPPSYFCRTKPLEELGMHPLYLRLLNYQGFSPRRRRIRLLPEERVRTNYRLRLFLVCF